MSKNKRKNKKSLKKPTDTPNGLQNGSVNGTANKIDILNDSSIKKVTVTMETEDGSTISRTEKKFSNGSIEHQAQKNDAANCESHHEHIHEEKNDYMEVNIDKFDDKEIKSVIRTTKNSDGTITKKTTVVTSYPDGRLETKHTEETFNPDEKDKISSSEQNLDNEETLSDQIDLDDKEEDSESEKKPPETDFKIERPAEKLTQTPAQNSEPFYSELPSILSALPDYLVVIKSNENLNNKSFVKVPSEKGLDSGVFYNSDEYEIMSKEEMANFKKLIRENKDLGSEIMSKHVHLLNYYGNVGIQKLKENLLLHLNSRNIFVRESDLDKCLKTIDHNLDGELNYIEFVDFFCLFFSTKDTIKKNLLSILNEHNVGHSDNGYLSSEEAKNFFLLLRKFYAFEHNAEFPHRISYDAFAANCLPYIENKLFF